MIRIHNIVSLVSKQQRFVPCTHNTAIGATPHQVSLSSSVAHENMVQLLDVFAEGTELIIVVRGMVCGYAATCDAQHNAQQGVQRRQSRSIRRAQGELMLL